MQLSDREIQNTLDLLKKQRSAGEADVTSLSAEEIEGIHGVVEQIGDMPEVRKDRVEKIKRAIESSSYNVTGDDVAKKLIGRILSDKIR
ncbi:MAG: flagellar biosynthesis anti-sigma factor FlgM [Actinobacteria bacterium]|nr:flagellar biosynthesis anti-sigma factor FlgM [Actinomycetota bacterium]